MKLNLKDIKDLHEAALKSEHDRAIIYIELCEIIEKQNAALKFYAKLFEGADMSQARRLLCMDVGKKAREAILEDE